MSRRTTVAAPPDDRRELLASLLRDLRVVRGRRAFGETAASARALADALGQLSATLVVFTAQLSERLTADSVADTMVGEP